MKSTSLDVEYLKGWLYKLLKQVSGFILMIMYDGETMLE